MARFTRIIGLLVGAGALGAVAVSASQRVEGAPGAPVAAPEPAPIVAAASPEDDADVAARIAAEAPPLPADCPEGMVLVEGEYCTEVRHTCREWADDPKLPYARCAVYEPRAECVGRRVHQRFCMDRTEYAPPGEDLPMNWASFETASRVCGDRGGRVCTEREWNFACEGEEMRPYPYGWERKPVCNQDRADLFVMRGGKQALRDHRQPAHEACASPFGVLDMAGNVDEPVLREEARYNPPYRNALKGGWWMAARNRCRPATTAHDDHYTDIQVGVRCCADAPGVGEGSG